MNSSRLFAECKHLLAICSVTLVVCTVMSAQSPASNSPGAVTVDSKAEPALQQRPRYLIESGDTVAVSFPLSPEFDQTVTVAPDGYIALRAAGDLSVAGKTLPELREALKTAYSGILHDPVINVDLKDFQKPFFTVSGEVTHPGKFDLRGTTSVAEALAVAGGTTQNAKSSQVLLFRRLPGGTMVEVRKLDIHHMMKKADLREDAYLQPGDLLYVPKSAISSIERFLPTSSLGLYTTGIP
jgi:protein involved in polysaccharide export with SLBB domain